MLITYNNVEYDVTTWCLLDGLGSIIYGPAALPQNYIVPDGPTFCGNFDQLDRMTLLSYRWVPVIEINATFDSTLYTRNSPSISILADKVVYEYTLTVLPIPDPIAVSAAEFQAAKTTCASNISLWFNQAFANGYYCSSVGWTMDCKRTDLANMQNLLTYLNNTGTSGSVVKDFDNITHQDVTTAQITGIVNDLIAYGLYLYAHKWALQQQLNNAITSADISAIKWS